jgi:hypothetical protein
MQITDANVSKKLREGTAVGAYEGTAKKMGFRREVRQGIDLLVEKRVSAWLDANG